MTKSEWPLAIFVVLLGATRLIETTSDHNHCSIFDVFGSQINLMLQIIPKQ